MNLRALLLSAVLLMAGTARAELLSLCYHDVTTDAATALEDRTAVSVSTLVSQLNWLAANDYVPVRLSDVIAARAGGPALPAKAVLLTFDDGYASFHQLVLPILELYQFPALLAPVTSWVSAPEESTVRYGDSELPRDRFLTWDQMQEVVDSGLVELASHSHDLHRGIPSNPQGNRAPAVTSLAYDAASGSYETTAEQLDRVRADLKASADLMAQQLGLRPRAIVWPYGEYSELSEAVGADLGMGVSLTLNGTDDVAASPHRVHRILIGSDMRLPQFVLAVRRGYPPQGLRAAHVDLDYVYDPDPQQQEQNLGLLLDRVKAMKLNAVILQAFADPDGNGAASALYFPNRHLPVKADLFNRAAWQLRTRAGVEVFAWLPVLSFELGEAYAGARVEAAAPTDGTRYPRLSPFDARNLEVIEQIYEDLAASSHIAGVLFHDDALLAEDEDASAAALDFYREQWSLPPGQDLSTFLASSEFTRRKTSHLIDLTGRLAEAVRRHRPTIRTARNLYAPVLLTPESEQRFAQSFAQFLEAYDYTALLAMPYLEDAESPDRWLQRLLGAVKRYPDGLAKTLFEVQTVDWRSGQKIPERELAAHLDLLLYSGARHIAYYPDDFVTGQPTLEMLRSRLSTNAYVALQD